MISKPLCALKRSQIVFSSLYICICSIYKWIYVCTSVPVRTRATSIKARRSNRVCCAYSTFTQPAIIFIPYQCCTTLWEFLSFFILLPRVMRKMIEFLFTIFSPSFIHNKNYVDSCEIYRSSCSRLFVPTNLRERPTTFYRFCDITKFRFFPLFVASFYWRVACFIFFNMFLAFLLGIIFNITKI